MKLLISWYVTFYQFIYLVVIFTSASLGVVPNTLMVYVEEVIILLIYLSN